MRRANLGKIGRQERMLRIAQVEERSAGNGSRFWLWETSRFEEEEEVEEGELSKPRTQWELVFYRVGYGACGAACVSGT